MRRVKTCISSGNLAKNCSVTIGCPCLASLGIQDRVLIQTSYVWSTVKGVKATGKAKPFNEMDTASGTLCSQLAPGAVGKAHFYNRHMVLLAASPNETHPGPTE